MAGASSSSSLEIKPAPRSIPIRVGSTPPSTSPASATASCAAATASWMSRARYFSALAQGVPVLGQGVILHQIEITDLGADVVGQSGHPKRLERTHHPMTFGQRRPNAVRTIAQRSHQAQTGYDHAAFGTKHESLVEIRRSRSRSSPSPEALTPVDSLHYYCFEGRARRHKLDVTRKFFADILEIRFRLIRSSDSPVAGSRDQGTGRDSCGCPLDSAVSPEA